MWTSAGRHGDEPADEWTGRRRAEKERWDVGAEQSGPVSRLLSGPSLTWAVYWSLTESTARWKGCANSSRRQSSAGGVRGQPPRFRGTPAGPVLQRAGRTRVLVEGCAAGMGPPSKKVGAWVHVLLVSLTLTQRKMDQFGGFHGNRDESRFAGEGVPAFFFFVTPPRTGRSSQSETQTQSQQKQSPAPSDLS